MKHIQKLALVSLLIILGCDKVREDDPVAQITMESLRYAHENNPVIIPIWGDFDDEDITILSSSDQANQLMTHTLNDDVRFVKYLPGSSADLIEFQVLQNDQVLGNGSVEVRLLGDNDCTNTGFSDYHQITQGESLKVDLMENDALCNWVPTINAAVRLTFVNPMEDVPEISELSGSKAMLVYTPTPGFTGRFEFIYELCFGWEMSMVVGIDEIGEEIDKIFLNPLNECQFYYVALATIDVI